MTTSGIFIDFAAGAAVGAPLDLPPAAFFAGDFFDAAGFLCMITRVEKMNKNKENYNKNKNLAIFRIIGKEMGPDYSKKNNLQTQ